MFEHTKIYVADANVKLRKFPLSDEQLTDYERRNCESLIKGNLYAVVGIETYDYETEKGEKITFKYALLENGGYVWIGKFFYELEF